MDRLVAMLRAAGDPTRLRLLLLLRQAELTVSELIEIVGQSQPRVSRHLKLLGEAGLLERFKEGSWVFYRAADRGTGAELGAAIAALADPGAAGDRQGAAGPCARGARQCGRRLFQGQCRGMGAHPRPACAGKRCGSGHRAASDGAADREFAGCRHRHRPDAGIARAACARAPWASMSARKCWPSPATGCCAATSQQCAGAAGRYLSPAVSQRLRRQRFRRRAVPPGAALSGRSGRRGGGSRARDGAGRAAADRRFRAA